MASGMKPVISPTYLEKIRALKIADTVNVSQMSLNCGYLLFMEGFTISENLRYSFDILHFQ